MKYSTIKTTVDEVEKVIDTNLKANKWLESIICLGDLVFITFGETSGS